MILKIRKKKVFSRGSVAELAKPTQQLPFLGALFGKECNEKI